MVLPLYLWINFKILKGLLSWSFKIRLMLLVYFILCWVLHALWVIPRRKESHRCYLKKKYGELHSMIVIIKFVFTLRHCICSLKGTPDLYSSYKRSAQITCNVKTTSITYNWSSKNVWIYLINMIDWTESTWNIHSQCKDTVRKFEVG